MKIRPHHVVLMTVGAHAVSGLEGRTRLHKEVYLTQALTQIRFVAFRAYLYGPYSDELTDGLRTCLALDLTEEDRTTLRVLRGENQSELLPRFEYRYRLTGRGSELHESLGNSDAEGLPGFAKGLSSVVDRTENLTVSELAEAAKIHFIIEEKAGEVLTVGEVVQRAKQKGWVLSDVDSRVQPLVQLGLLRVD